MVSCLMLSMDPVRSKIMQMCVRSPCDLSCDCVMRVPLGWCETNSIGLNQHGSAPGKWGHNRREKTKVNTQHKTFHAIATASPTGKKYFIFLEFSTSQKISPATILKFRELFQNKRHTFSSTPAHFTVHKSHKLFQNKCHTFTAPLSIEASH